MLQVCYFMFIYINYGSGLCLYFGYLCGPVSWLGLSCDVLCQLASDNGHLSQTIDGIIVWACIRLHYSYILLLSLCVSCICSKLKNKVLVSNMSIINRENCWWHYSIFTTIHPHYSYHWEISVFSGSVFNVAFLYN